MVERNKIRFGMGTLVDPIRNIVLDRGPDPPRRGGCDAALVKILWSLLLFIAKDDDDDDDDDDGDNDDDDDICDILGDGERVGKCLSWFSVSLTWRQ